MSSFKNHKSFFIPVALLALLVVGIGLFVGNNATPVQANSYHQNIT